MRIELEFHNSKILSIAQVGAAIQINLDAFIHRWDKSSGAWKGEGWRQPVVITLAGELKPPPPLASQELETGVTPAGKSDHTHMVPLPFQAAGPATLRLETMEGEVLDLSGRDLQIAATGEGRFVENLPDAFKPVG